MGSQQFRRQSRNTNYFQSLLFFYLLRNCACLQLWKNGKENLVLEYFLNQGDKVGEENLNGLTHWRSYVFGLQINQLVFICWEHWPCNELNDVITTLAGTDWGHEALNQFTIKSAILKKAYLRFSVYRV